MQSPSFIEPADWLIDALPGEVVAIFWIAVLAVVVVGVDWPSRK
jgi:hypothetical protein